MKFTLEHLAKKLLPHVAANEFFSPQERKTIASAAEVVLEGCPVSLSSHTVVQNLEAFLVLGKSRRAWRIRVLIAIIEFAPCFLLGKKRFSRLDLEQRKRLVIEKFMHGRFIWSICGKIRELVYLGVYGDPRTEAAIGFVPWQERPRYQIAKPLHPLTPNSHSEEIML